MTKRVASVTKGHYIQRVTVAGATLQCSLHGCHADRVDFDDFCPSWRALVSFDKLHDQIIDDKIKNLDHGQQTAAHEQAKIAAKITCTTTNNNI